MIIREFNEFDPESSEVEKWEEIIKDNYPIYTWKEDKYISISDKTYFLTGKLLNKGRLTDKIFFDIKDDYPEAHDPSLRKAIRNWINKNSGNKINENSSEEINIEMYFENLLDDCDYAIESYEIKKKLKKNFKYTIVHVEFKKSFLEKRIYIDDLVSAYGQISFPEEEVMNFWPNIISLISQFRNLGLKVALRYHPNLTQMIFEISEEE